MRRIIFWFIIPTLIFSASCASAPERVKGDPYPCYLMQDLAFRNKKNEDKSKEVPMADLCKKTIIHEYCKNPENRAEKQDYTSCKESID